MKKIYFALITVLMVLFIINADLPQIGDTVSTAELNAIVDRTNELYEDDTVYAYVGVDTTEIAIANEWYVVAGTFVNDFGRYWELGTTGIKRKSNAPTKKFALNFMIGGVAEDAGDVKIAIVKNGVFTNGRLTTGSILEGSGGKDYADTVGAPNGEVNPRCAWQGTAEADDEFTLVMTSTSITNVISDGGNARAFSVR